MERDKMFLATTVNSYDRSQQTVGHVRKVLIAALTALGDAPDEVDFLPQSQVPAVAAVYRDLYLLPNTFPEVHAWAVVKNYSNPGWEPRAWVACLNKKQAQEVCIAVADYYNAEADKNGWKKDRWTVEYRPVHIRKILRKGVTGKDYVGTLHR